MFESLPDVVNVKEACGALGICDTSMYRLIKSGKIKCVRIGNAIRIPIKCMIDFVEDECYNNTTVAGNSVLSLKEV